MQRKPVLIVGAGPVGLLIANGLAANNIPFEIIDRKPGPSTESKGLALNISSQMAFRLCGIDDSLGIGGCRIKRLDIHWNQRRYSSINFAHLPTDRNYLITQPQWVTEQELINVLEHPVHWSRELVGVCLKDDTVIVQIKSADGITSTEYDFVVGCDGKHSIVRSYITQEAQTTQYNMHFVLGDFHITEHLSRDTVQYQVFEHGFYILVPISEELTRVVVKFDGPPPERPVKASDIVDYVNHKSGMSLLEGDPTWISRAPFYNSVCSRIQNDRLFIAGDAAHLFSPIGGTGMNTGFQDAINLTWRLSYYYQGYSGKDILNAYEKERVPANTQGMLSADANTMNIADVTQATPFIEAIAPVPHNRPNLRDNFPSVMSGYTYSLETTKASVGAIGLYHTALCDLVLMRKKHGNGRFLLRHTLLLNSSLLTVMSIRLTTERCAEFDFVDVVVILEDDLGNIPDHLRYPYTLLRPDGVIEMVCNSRDISPILEYLEGNYQVTSRHISTDVRNAADLPAGM